MRRADVDREVKWAAKTPGCPGRSYRLRAVLVLQCPPCLRAVVKTRETVADCRLLPRSRGASTFDCLVQPEGRPLPLLAPDGRQQAKRRATTHLIGPRLDAVPTDLRRVQPDKGWLAD